MKLWMVAFKPRVWKWGVYVNKVYTKSLYERLLWSNTITSLSSLQLSGPPHDCRVSLHAQHFWGRSRLLLFLFGQMPPDPRLNNPQHLSRGTAEGPRAPGVLSPTHFTHLVPPWRQPSATCPHQGNLQPLHQADLETHAQVDARHVVYRNGRRKTPVCVNVFLLIRCDRSEAVLSLTGKYSCLKMSGL